MIKEKLLYKTLHIVDVARVSQLMARRMYGIGSRTTENSGPIKLSRQCAMALCRALLTWLFGKSMISKTESKHCSQPCFHWGFYEDQIRPLSAGQKLKFLPLSLGWSLQHNVLGFSHLSHSLMGKIKLFLQSIKTQRNVRKVILIFTLKFDKEKKIPTTRWSLNESRSIN